jgi:hypothetical protein
MTTTQRPRPARQSAPPPDPARRGLILVTVAVVLGVILLVKGGGVGFDTDSSDVQIATGQGDGQVEQTTTTVEAPPVTSVPRSQLNVAALNAAGVTGYAGRAQQFLGIAGYSSVAPVTALNTVERTVVYYAEGFQIDALELAKVLEIDDPSQVQPLPTDEQLARDPAELPADLDVAVLLGPDVSGVVDGASRAAGEAPAGTGTGTGTGTGAAGTGTGT